MTTQIGTEKILADNQLRVSSAATTILGAAQAKGTATDLLLTLVGGPDGATAIAGSTAVTIEGSNLTATATSNWTAVTADKGTLVAAVTAVTTSNAHFQNLQYAFYHVKLVNATTATCNVTAVFNYQPMADSFDATVA